MTAEPIAGDSSPARGPWHIVTGEYPPQPGGVSDYTEAVARGLAGAGEEVHVWCPGREEPRAADGVDVHPVAGRWLAGDMDRVDALLDRFATPRRLFVQWVPHAYGRRSLNITFCRWVRQRAAAGDRVELMVHEPFLGLGEGSLKHNAAALVHRAMAATLLSAAARVWVSVPAWADALRPWTFGRTVPFCWLPVPSTIPVSPRPDRVAGTRGVLASPDEVLIGHFGTYGRLVAEPLRAVMRGVLDAVPQTRLVFLGRGSQAFVTDAFGDGPASARVAAADDLTTESISWHLQACDLMVQPYPDGVSTRRTTAMAALAHGRPMVTTTGRLSEPFWATSPAVSVAPAGDDDALEQATTSLALDPGPPLAARCRGEVAVRRALRHLENHRRTRQRPVFVAGRLFPAAG